MEHYQMLSSNQSSLNSLRALLLLYIPPILFVMNSNFSCTDPILNVPDGGPNR